MSGCVQAGNGFVRELEMYYCGILLAATLLGGCKNETSPPQVAELPPARVVATVYAARSDTGNTACHRAPAAASALVSTLSNGQLADLVSMQEGVVKNGNDYWLHVYPRLGHRPSCYININQLVPVS